jgi:hypothetical protein
MKSARCAWVKFCAAWTVAAVLIGCGRGEQSASSAPAGNRSQPLPAPPTIGNFPPDEGTRIAGASIVASSGAEGAALILERFRDDLANCARLIDVLRSDARLAGAVERAIAQPDGDLERVLRDSRAYDQIRPLVGSREFVRLEVSRLGDPHAAAVLESRAIICAPTRARLSEIEQLGPSAAAWTVREYFLTGTLRAVRMPWAQDAVRGVEFDALRADIEDALRVYRGPLRERLETWLSNAANLLRREQNLAEATPDGQTAEQHRDAVGEWIDLLESLRSIRIEANRR